MRGADDMNRAEEASVDRRCLHTFLRGVGGRWSRTHSRGLSRRLQLPKTVAGDGMVPGEAEPFDTLMERCAAIEARANGSGA